MRYKYQLVFLGNLGTNSNKIENLFFEKVSDLKLLKETFLIINRTNFEKLYKENQPSFCLYFGSSNRSFQDFIYISRLIKDASPILPIFKSSFTHEIPKELENYNGQKYDDTKDSKIVNLALEAFGKLRHSRKVFVSYKREDSTSVAIQLYEALEKNNFDVFLDTHSIKQGELFQEELWHRMTDSDVIIMLNTKGFMTSRWCKEELAEASAKQIGILQLVWPNHKLEDISHICHPISLNEDDFINNQYLSKTSSILKEDLVKRVVSETESLRARNLAARQDNLITEFTNIADKYGRIINLQPERFLTENLEKNKRRIFIPTIGVPQSFDCNRSDTLREEIDEFNIENIYLIYDDIRIREKWLNHLDWLNKFLDVKTLKKQNFDKWLQKN